MNNDGTSYYELLVINQTSFSSKEKNYERNLSSPNHLIPASSVAAGIHTKKLGNNVMDSGTNFISPE
jgi:hypothetical protein